MLHIIGYFIGYIIGIVLVVGLLWAYDRFQSWRYEKDYMKWQESLVYGELPPWSEEYR